MEYIFKKCIKCSFVYPYKHEKCPRCEEPDFTAEEPDRDANTFLYSIITSLCLSVVATVCIDFLFKDSLSGGDWAMSSLVMIFVILVFISFQVVSSLLKIQDKWLDGINARPSEKCDHNYIEGLINTEESSYYNDPDPAAAAGTTTVTRTTWIVYCDLCGLIKEKKEDEVTSVTS